MTAFIMIAVGDWIDEALLASRRLLKSPGFTAASIATLALGIAATTAIFSVASAVLLRPLPYPEADRLVSVEQHFNGARAGVGEPKFLFWREKATSFAGLACYSSYGGASGNLAGGSDPEFVTGLRVSADFFKVLGVSPALGRVFTAEEDVPGAAKVGLISDGLWRRRFGADPGILGRNVTLSDEPVAIIGVLPADFRVGSSSDLFLPMQARSTANYDPNATVIGRLRPGVSLTEAAAEMRLIAEQYRGALPAQMAKGESAGVEPYQSLFTEGVARTLWILLGAVSFLLLIACANVAHLQIARAASRQKEFAVRAALGGGAWRVARQLLVESLLVAGVSGALGLLLGAYGTRGLIAMMPPGYLPDVSVVSLDWRVLAFAILVSTLTGLIAGMGPVLQARQLDVGATLKQNSSRGATGHGQLRAALVVTELALSLALLGGAGLLTRTFANLLSVEPGFDSRNVLTFRLAPQGDRYKTTVATAAFYRSALERIAQLRGVQAAAVTNKLPLDWQFNMPVSLSDKPDEVRSVQLRMVTPDYFKAMSIAVRAGRAFAETDDASSPAVAIVNEAFARRYLDGGWPFSRQVTVGRRTLDVSREITGVVGDIKQSGLNQPAPPMVYLPIPQVSDRLMQVFRAFTPTFFVVRSELSATALVPPIRAEIAKVDSTLAISEIAPMADVTSRSVGPQRFNLLLIAVFGTSALALALVGVYGVMSHGVAQQFREIGVRMALGAHPADVVRLIVKQGFRLATAGATVGAALFLLVASVLEDWLYEVSARDPLVFLGALGTVGAMALLASYIPARRAALVDPIEALRAE